MFVKMKSRFKRACISISSIVQYEQRMWQNDANYDDGDDDDNVIQIYLCIDF